MSENEKQESAHEDKHLQVDEQNEDTNENIEEDLNNETSVIEDLQAQIASLKDENLREQADFLNVKKRLEKEKFQAIGYAHEQFARDLLPIIDALENAIVSVSETKETPSEEAVNKYKEGIELTIEQFHKCFDKHGIKDISKEGEFDPNVHEAIMKVESDEIESGHIVQTLQKGYTIKDRVLRPAMVSIAK